MKYLPFNLSSNSLVLEPKDGSLLSVSESGTYPLASGDSLFLVACIESDCRF